MTKHKIYGIITGETFNTGFGFDEENTAFDSFKELIENFFLQLDGSFMTTCDAGLGIFTAEAVLSCGKGVICVMPYENQASRWNPELRERFFSIHEHSEKVVMLSTHYYEGCESEAEDYIASNCDELIVIKSSKEKLSDICKCADKKITVIDCDDLTISFIN